MRHAKCYVRIPPLEPLFRMTSSRPLGKQEGVHLVGKASSWILRFSMSAALVSGVATVAIESARPVAAAQGPGWSQSNGVPASPTSCVDVGSQVDCVTPKSYSVDGGLSFSASSSPVPFSTFQISCVAMPAGVDCAAVGSYGFGVGATWGAAYTTNGGVTWQVASVPNTLEDEDVSCAAAGAQVDCASEWLYSTDGGATWSQSTNGEGGLFVTCTSTGAAADCIAP
jgi:BNR/Asp-box repeat